VPDHSCPQVIAISSGKGGVGKTTVTTNLAAAIAARGHRVLILDGDLGLANAQIALGTSAARNISHVLSGECELGDIVIEAAPGISLVPGASGVRAMADLGSAQIAGIVNAFSTLRHPADFLLVDTAAGLSSDVIELLAAAQRRIVVMRDEPSSIADAYGLIKLMIKEEKLDEIYLLPNMVASELEGQQLFGLVNDVCRRFLGTTTGYLTSIENDELILDALRQHRPILSHAPGSAGARDFRRLAQIVCDLPPITQPTGRVQFFMERMLQSPAAS
jgi:flagellar biosynthesis protein FlhG